MSSGVVFLQSTLDETPKALGSYKPGNTEVIRALLREQQKDCRSLHQNPIFRELRSDHVKHKKFGKGYVVAENGAPAIDDFDAEGQARMFDLIRNTATNNDKEEKGVWASFGKPYVCLGEPTQLERSLPKLNRDEMEGRESKNSKPTGKKNQASGRGNYQGFAANTRRADNKSRESNQVDLPFKDQETIEKMSEWKAVLKFGGIEKSEAKFPEAPLKKATQRKTKIKTSTSTFVNRADGEFEANDPAIAYGFLPQPTLKPSRNLAPLKSKSAHAQDGDDGKSFFLTQAGEVGTGELNEAGNQSRRSSQTGTASNRVGAAAPIEETTPAGADSPPSNTLEFKSITNLAKPVKGDENNPIYRWHNQFVQARQSGRMQLQQALLERSEGRRRARTTSPLAANLASAILFDLDLAQGSSSSFPLPGQSPASPFMKMEQYNQAQMERQKMRTRSKSLANLEPSEVQILQRFYDQLCALVEQQRMSDPLSLMVVHKVKSLLEQGVFLHKPMLVQVLEHIHAFTKGCGLLRYNQFILPVLTFISKCVGVSDDDFANLVEEQELLPVVYGDAGKPQ